MFDNDYCSRFHSKTLLRYHMIFSTKFRYKFLYQIRDTVFKAFRYTESISVFQILTMELDWDHIHILITFPPKYSITQVVRRLKQTTTYYIYEHELAYLRRWYWGNKKLLWTHGYFCSTIGSVSEDTVRRYRENQG